MFIAKIKGSNGTTQRNVLGYLSNYVGTPGPQGGGGVTDRRSYRRVRRTGSSLLLQKNIDKMKKGILCVFQLCRVMRQKGL